MPSSQNEPHRLAGNLSSLNMDLLFRILDYLRAQRSNTNYTHETESCRDLISLAFTNRLFNQLLLRSSIYDDLGKNSHFDALFGFHGKRYWNNMYQFNHLLTNKFTLPRPRKQQPPASTSFKSLQILSEDREMDSLGYYNSTLVQPEVPCSGYFGFEVLRQEVVVFGDFSGVSFHSSVSDFVSCAKPTGTILSSYRLQVMVVLQERDYLFLGFANGDIDCLQIKSSSSRAISTSTKVGGEADAMQEEYPYISGSTQMHTNEITSLANISSNHLASGSIMSSRILIHWNALRDGNLNRTSSLVYAVDSVLSLSSCISSDGLVQLAVGASDQNLIHSVWAKDLEENLTCNNSPLSDDDEAHFLFPDGLTENNRVSISQKGHVVHLSYHDEHLIVGMNKGSVIVMNKDINLDGLKYTLENCCSGNIVESVKVIGNIIVTTGGSDGCIRFWDWETGAALVQWLIHPGREIQGKQIKGTVVSVDFCHERSSLITLCHDGYVREICIAVIEKKCKQKKQKQAQWRKRPISDSACMKSSEDGTPTQPKKR